LGKVPVDGTVALTGELTLRGKVLPIGGLKEKVLAAYRFGLKTIVLPKENEKDLAEVPEEVGKKISFHLVETMDEVLEKALVRPISPLNIRNQDRGKGMGEEPADGSVTH
jgi:ATP-dependent Lon protease